MDQLSTNHRYQSSCSTIVIFLYAGTLDVSEFPNQCNYRLPSDCFKVRRFPSDPKITSVNHVYLLHSEGCFTRLYMTWQTHPWLQYVLLVAQAIQDHSSVISIYINLSLIACLLSITILSPKRTRNTHDSAVTLPHVLGYHRPPVRTKGLFKMMLTRWWSRIPYLRILRKDPELKTVRWSKEDIESMSHVRALRRETKELSSIIRNIITTTTGCCPQPTWKKTSGTTKDHIGLLCDCDLQLHAQHVYWDCHDTPKW